MSDGVLPAADIPVSDAAATPPVATVSSGANWSVALLTIAAFLAAVDRQAMANLLDPIKKDLQVSDAAMGLLAGSALSLIYAFVAIPMAMLADRVNRRNLIGASIAFWSGAAFLGGLARTFPLLLVARIAVGAGEAGVQPAAMSTFGDLAPPAKRGTPISVYVSGGALGFACGGVISGLINDRFGWHAAIMAMAVPGMLLALVMLLTVREPRRGAFDGAAAEAPRESLLKGLARCGRISTFYPFGLGYIFLNLCYVGWLVWMPAFLQRTHNLTLTQSGLVMLVITFGGMVATLAWGPVSDRLAQRAPRYRLLFAAAIAVVSAPLMAVASQTQGLPVTLAFLMVYTLIGGSLTAITQTTYLSMAPVRMRGLVTAIMNIISMGVGGGLAPIVYGQVNDWLKPAYGNQSLHYTMLIPPAAMTIAGVLFLIASRTMDRDVARVSEV